MCTIGPFPHRPDVKFGEEFDWNADRRAVHLSCVLDGGPEHIWPLQIYILEEALIDAWQLAGRTGKPKTDELVNLAKQRWKKQILLVVERQIRAADWDSDGSILVTSAKLREQRRPAPDFNDPSPKNGRI
jgi:hypothetical protein